MNKAKPCHLSFQIFSFSAAASTPMQPPESIFDLNSSLEPCLGSDCEGDFFTCIFTAKGGETTNQDGCADYAQTNPGRSSTLEFLDPPAQAPVTKGTQTQDQAASITSAHKNEHQAGTPGLRRVRFRDEEFSRLVAERMFVGSELPVFIEPGDQMCETSVSKSGRVCRRRQASEDELDAQTDIGSDNEDEDLSDDKEEDDEENVAPRSVKLGSRKRARNSDCRNNEEGADSNDSRDKDWINYSVARQIRTRSASGAMMHSSLSTAAATLPGSRDPGFNGAGRAISQPPQYVIQENSMHRKGPKDVDRSAAKPNFYKSNELYRGRKRYSGETLHKLWNGLIDKMRDSTGWKSSRHADPNAPPPPKLYKLAMETQLPMEDVKRYLYNAAKKGREWLARRNLTPLEKKKRVRMRTESCEGQVRRGGK